MLVFEPRDHHVCDRWTAPSAKGEGKAKQKSGPDSSSDSDDVPLNARMTKPSHQTLFSCNECVGQTDVLHTWQLSNRANGIIVIKDRRRFLDQIPVVKHNYWSTVCSSSEKTEENVRYLRYRTDFINSETCIIHRVLKSRYNSLSVSPPSLRMREWNLGSFFVLFGKAKEAKPKAPKLDAAFS